MKIPRFPSALTAALLLGFAAITLSACSYHQKGWQNYNKQVNLLQDSDKQLFLEAVQNTLETSPSNTEMPWVNSDGTVAGTVVPISTVQKNSGVYCRVYQATFSGSEVTDTSTAAACRNPDGVWDTVQPNRIGS